MAEAKRKEEDTKRVDLRRPMNGPMRVKDPQAAMASLRAACKGDPDKLERLEAIGTLSAEDQERWLLGKARQAGEGDRQAGCAIVVFIVLVVVGYKIVKYFDEATQQWREEREAITEEREVEKEVCEDDK